MSDDYLWTRSGIPDPDTKQLEELLEPLAHDAPLDELRVGRARKRELARATAHEPDQLAVVQPTTQAPPASRRVKGKMIALDKRVIGGVSLAVAASALLGLDVYKSRVADTPRESRGGIEVTYPHVDRDHDFEPTRRFAPVSPMTNASLAITAGESARIHVASGGVDLEIQSGCNAEVELSAFARSFGRMYVVQGVDRPDGRAATYDLEPSTEPSRDPELFDYTSRCEGRPPVHGTIAIDRYGVDDPIGEAVNGHVYSLLSVFDPAEGVHVFGAVLPGATVSVGAHHVELEPPDFDLSDSWIDPTFSIDVPVATDHPAAAVRVDDANGTQFYVFHAIGMVRSCSFAMERAGRTAESLARKGDHAGALTAIQSGLSKCKPNRETWSLALSYACAAGDVAAARSYWRKLPVELRKTLDPACGRAAITRETLDAP